MNIAQVCLRFGAPGGVETNVRAVAGGLRALGESVRVYSSDLYDEGRWDRRRDLPTELDGVPVERFPVYKRLIPGLTMPLMPGLIDALSASEADVIHAHSHRYGHVLQSALVAGRRGVPLVVSTHYHPADRREPSWKRGALRIQDFLFGSSAYRTAAALVVETELEARLVREFAPGSRIHIIPPGVDLAEWQHPAEDRLPSGLPARYILFAGRIASNKGLAGLLEALKELPELGRPDLVLLGPDWGERTSLEARAARLGISSSVHFLGSVDDRASWRAIFRHAELFVLPSEWEAFGLVLLEAMAAGVAVVATNVGGVPEVLQGGRVGALVEYGDPTALSSAIDRLLQDPSERARLASEGRRRVTGLTWAVAAERHRELYRSVQA